MSTALRLIISAANPSPQTRREQSIGSDSAQQFVRTALMADQEANGSGNGAGDNPQPQVSILAQYVKDLSVENPSAPQVYSWQVQPQLDVQFNLNAQGAGDGVHEVSLKFDISARSENGVHFVVDLTYAGLFNLQNV